MSIIDTVRGSSSRLLETGQLHIYELLCMPLEVVEFFVSGPLGTRGIVAQHKQRKTTFMC